MALHEMEERFHRFAMCQRRLKTDPRVSITPALTAITLPSAESIDELSLNTVQGKRADYLWRRRSVAR